MTDLEAKLRTAEGRAEIMAAIDLLDMGQHEYVCLRAALRVIEEQETEIREMRRALDHPFYTRGNRTPGSPVFPENADPHEDGVETMRTERWKAAAKQYKQHRHDLSAEVEFLRTINAIQRRRIVALEMRFKDTPIGAPLKEVSE